MKKRLSFIMALVLATLVMMQSAMACTILGIGKDATTDGSTMVTHTCDSTGDDFRLWIIPEMEGGEGITRDIVMDGNTWGDWSDYPNLKDYGSGMVIDEMPQPENTYQYLHSNYSLINEYGVAMGESTCGFTTSDDHGKKLVELLRTNNDGIIDCYQAQHIALERATTAREAVQVMADLVEEYGWNAYAENINICDGEEVWIAEFYGLDLWCAVRIPDDAFFVCANRCRINEIDFEDTENYMYSENLKQFAIDNELWSEESGEAFAPANIYAPNSSLYASRREWRAFDLVAPSLNLDPEAGTYPLYVVPDEKLSVQDVFKINGDHYQGTEYDTALEPQAGPYGNPIGDHCSERAIGIYRATYHTIANVKSWLPNEAKALIWYGHGAPDSSYIVPLFASMTELPEIYANGNRWGSFDRDSAWWTASYVQQTATQNYQSAIQEIYALRDPMMEEQYAATEAIQEEAAALIEEGKNDEAVALLTDFAYNNAEKWHETWLELGDDLYGTYMFNRVDMKEAAYSDWWKDIINNAPRNPGFEEAAE